MYRQRQRAELSKKAETIRLQWSPRSVGSISRIFCPPRKNSGCKNSSLTEILRICFAFYAFASVFAIVEIAIQYDLIFSIAIRFFLNRLIDWLNIFDVRTKRKAEIAMRKKFSPLHSSFLLHDRDRFSEIGKFVDIH